MTVTVRTVDDAQYVNRLRGWDFDIITHAWGESLSPGNEQRGYWGSQAADQPGSDNLIGIKNPGGRRDDRSGHLRQEPRGSRSPPPKRLDRVLLWNHYVVPQWTYPYAAHRALGPLQPSRPDAEIRLAAAFPTVWWWDAEKAAKTGSRP